MYYSKDIERFGTGLKRIADACNDAGVKYEFTTDNYGFTVIFHRPPLWISDNIEDNIGDSIGDSIGNSKTREKILAIMKANPKVSAKSIALEIGISLRNVEANISKLRKAGLIKHVGPAFGGYWEVL